ILYSRVLYSIMLHPLLQIFIFFFFCNHTAPDQIHTLSLHDALPIFGAATEDEDRKLVLARDLDRLHKVFLARDAEKEIRGTTDRSEEHTSELQSRGHLVCRLLLEKKKRINKQYK